MKGDPVTTARKIRELCLRMLYRSQTAHLASSLSEADILAVLYDRILKHKAADPDWNMRDRFILSKGHGAAALYAVLALKGYFPKPLLDTYYANGSKLAGHVMKKGVPGVELSTGSLGHGLPVGTGMALAGKRDGKSWRVFVLLSDGEMDEGSNWEAILFAGHHKLNNLVAIVDYNKIQSLDRTEKTLDLEPLAAKFKDFGWEVQEVAGHDAKALEQALSRSSGKPSCIIAHTVKGKGISFMEQDGVKWHYANLTEEQLKQAIGELQ